MSLHEYLSTGPAYERAVVEAVLSFVHTLGPVHIEPVSVGVFVKKSGGWVQLRPKTKWVALSFPFPRAISDARMTRKPIDVGSWVFHVVNLRSPADFDETVKGWLSESYDFAK